MLNAINEKTHVERELSRNDLEMNNNYLQDQKNQFYQNLNKESDIDFYRAKNLGDNENVFNEEVKVTKFTKNGYN